MVFGQKMAILPRFFFQAIQARKISFTIFYNGKASFWAIKTRSSKRRKIDIFQKGLTHGFGRKIAIFPIFFFKALYASKMSFTIFQNEKTPFQSIKTRSLKSRKIEWFSSKNGLFSNFLFLGTIGQENVFYDILKRKITFLGYKNKKFKKSKN